MNYTDKINNILENKNIWGEDLKSIKISKNKIEKIKKELGGFQRLDLNRILLVSKTFQKDKPPESTLFISNMALLISVSGFFYKITPKLIKSSYAKFMIIAFLFLMFAINKGLTNEEIYNNNTNTKIDCIIISVKELLK